MAKTVEDISTLKINILSQAQYEAEVAGGTVAENELYFTPSLGSGVSDVEVDGESVVSGGVAQIIMPVVPEKVSDLLNDLGFLTSETDPTVPAWAKVPVKPSYNFSEINSTPTTLSGYGITDAKISNGVITLGNSTITPLTSYTETDPTVPSWAKQSSKPTYTALEVGALPNTTVIPTKTSDLTNDSDFVSDANYVHTDNNFTTAEKNKLSGIEVGAEVNVQANWNQSDSTADDYIKNKPTIPTPPSPSSTTPVMDGTASVGSEMNYARGDHRHPADTSKQNILVSGTNIKTINGNSILGSGDLQVGGTDYIVEQGTSGIWTYRKWNSGLLECWGFTSVASDTYSASGGSKQVAEATPSLFNGAPTYIQVSGYISSVIRTSIGYTCADSSWLQTYLINDNAYAVTATGGVYWELKGTWK